MTETKSNFDCRKCHKKNMLFVNNEKFVCFHCGYSWELTDMGKDLLRSLD